MMMVKVIIVMIVTMMMVIIRMVMVKVVMMMVIMMMMGGITLFLYPFKFPSRCSFVSQQHLLTVIYSTVCQVPREIIKVCVIK